MTAIAPIRTTTVNNPIGYNQFARADDWFDLVAARDAGRLEADPVADFFAAGRFAAAFIAAGRFAAAFLAAGRFATAFLAAGRFAAGRAPCAFLRDEDAAADRLGGLRGDLDFVD